MKKRKDSSILFSSGTLLMNVLSPRDSFPRRGRCYRWNIKWEGGQEAHQFEGRLLLFPTDFLSKKFLRNF